VPGAHVRVLAGAAYGQASPVRSFSPLCYLDVRIDAGAELELPNDLPESAAYVASGAISVGHESIAEPKLIVFCAGQRAVLRATSAARLLVLAGEPLESPRHIFWNFVSSSAERIERAKRDWAERHFPLVPGDEEEFVPLPAH
jgi:redox-sensitive bicupin YhaK (pirin superfamily)